ncbi:MAG: hypothetical protein IJ348_03850 [Alistipes sp.]|nr:hypothetical protein [Alistipes sp.]
MTISNVIHKHLQQQRRLVIPNLGAFMVKESGEILFSELLKGDDGVFRSLLTAEGLSEFEVAAVADRFLFEVRHAIGEQGCYILGDWGALVKGADGTLSFESRLAEQIRAEQKPVSKIEQPAEEREAEQALEPAAEKEAGQALEQTLQHPVKEEVTAPRPQVTTEPASVATKAPENPPQQAEEAVAAEIKREAKSTPTRRQAKAPQRRGADRFILLAVTVLILALAAIGYGYYVSQLAPEADDAQMDALRVTVERPSNN